MSRNLAIVDAADAEGTISTWNVCPLVLGKASLEMDPRGQCSLWTMGVKAIPMDEGELFGKTVCIVDKCHSAEQW